MFHSAKVDVFVDVCIQRDYVSPRGTRRCINAEQIRANVKHLIAYARWAKLSVLSCIDRRRANAIGGDMYCSYSRRSPEQEKPPFSLLPSHTVIESDNCLCVSLDLLQRYQQVILTKWHRDPFTNPKLDRLLTELPARRFVLFGVPIESSLRILALGLLLRKRRVALVYDACGYWDVDQANMALRQLGVKGCELCSTERLIRTAVTRLGNHYRERNGDDLSVA